MTGRQRLYGPTACLTAQLKWRKSAAINNCHAWRTRSGLSLAIIVFRLANLSKNSTFFVVDCIFWKPESIQILWAFHHQMQFFEGNLRVLVASFPFGRFDSIVIKLLKKVVFAFSDGKWLKFRKNKSTFAEFGQRQIWWFLSHLSTLPACRDHVPKFALLDKPGIEFYFASEMRI